MSRGATSTGVGAVALLFVVFMLTACGGGSSPTVRDPAHPSAELRSKIQRIMNRRLARFDASPRQIACVDRAIRTASAAEISRRLNQGDVQRPHHKKTPKQVAGALSGNCF